jgi:hypothetical protein
MAKTQVESAVQMLWADLDSALKEELAGLPWQVIQTDVSKIEVAKAGSLDPELTISVGQERNDLIARYKNPQIQEQCVEITFLENGDSGSFKSSADRLLVPASVAKDLLRPLLK